MRRVVAAAILVGAAVVLLSAGGGVGAWLGWLVTGYLLWRAAPRVWRDASALAGVVLGARGALGGLRRGGSL